MNRPDSSLPKRRRRYRPDQVIQFIQAFERSGQTARDFTRANGLHYQVFLRWLSRKRRGLMRLPDSIPRQTSPGPLPKTPEFREFSFTPPATATRWAAEVHRPNGTLLRLAHDVDPVLALKLLRSC